MSEEASDDIMAKGESDDMSEEMFSAVWAIEHAWREVDKHSRELEARTAFELADLQFLAVLQNVEHAMQPSN